MRAGIPNGNWVGTYPTLCNSNSTIYARAALQIYKLQPGTDTSFSIATSKTLPVGTYVHGVSVGSKIAYITGATSASMIVYDVPPTDTVTTTTITHTFAPTAALYSIANDPTYVAYSYDGAGTGKFGLYTQALNSVYELATQLQRSRVLIRDANFNFVGIGNATVPANPPQFIRTTADWSVLPSITPQNLPVTSGRNFVRGAAAGNDVIVAYCSTNTSPSYNIGVLVSDDGGATWDEVDLPVPSADSTLYGVGIYRPIEFANGKFHAVTTLSYLTSTDGRNWTCESVGVGGGSDCPIVVGDNVYLIVSGGLSYEMPYKDAQYGFNEDPPPPSITVPVFSNYGAIVHDEAGRPLVVTADNNLGATTDTIGVWSAG